MVMPIEKHLKLYSQKCYVVKLNNLIIKIGDMLIN